jgi:hypothetical protein
MLRGDTSYESEVKEFRWKIPEKYNIGVDVCDKWAALDPEQPALIHEQANGHIEVAPFVRTVFSIFKWNAGRSRCRFHRGQHREVSFIRGLVRQT